VSEDATGASADRARRNDAYTCSGIDLASQGKQALEEVVAAHDELAAVCAVLGPRIRRPFVEARLGEHSWPALVARLPWLAVTVWIAGFDLLYTCQDVEFDRGERLHAVPARFGIPAPFRAARVCHALTALALAAVGAVTALGPAYWVGWAVVVGLLVYEHSLVSADDLSPPDVPSSTSTATSA
jgi:UbiA prenyltransferase family